MEMEFTVLLHNLDTTVFCIISLMQTMHSHLTLKEEVDEHRWHLDGEMENFICFITFTFDGT